MVFTPRSDVFTPHSDVFTPHSDERPEDVVWPELAWPPADSTVLTGRTVELTPFDAGRDAGGLFGALDHDAVWAHVNGRWPTPSSLVETLRARRATGQLPWVLRLVRPLAGLETGAVVGLSCYLDPSVADARLEIGSTLYTPAVWATQVNPEAKLLLLEHAFEHLRAGRVQLKTDIRNQRSQRAIDRLGARFEGVLRRHARRADGTVRDSVMFSVTAEDWPAVRNGLLDRLQYENHH
jgi:RimJ/RimL family protein N-acetyltransferase